MNLSNDKKKCNNKYLVEIFRFSMYHSCLLAYGIDPTTQAAAEISINNATACRIHVEWDSRYGCQILDSSIEHATTYLQVNVRDI